MHKYLAWTVLAAALLGAGVASADQITIINKSGLAVTGIWRGNVSGKKGHFEDKGQPVTIANVTGPQSFQIPPGSLWMRFIGGPNSNDNRSIDPIISGKTYELTLEWMQFFSHSYEALTARPIN